MNKELRRPEQHNLHLIDRLKNFGHFVVSQLTTADLNPHEGKLRASVMPAKYMGIPDCPPLHDDVMPDL